MRAGHVAGQLRHRGAASACCAADRGQDARAHAGGSGGRDGAGAERLQVQGHDLLQAAAVGRRRHPRRPRPTLVAQTTG